MGLLILVGGLAVLAVGVEREGRRWVGRDLPTADAEWIWASLPRGFTDPVAFWAVRDFELDAPPAAASLLLLAEEEYVAYLNGRRVGSNRHLPGDAVDRYRVEALLLPGGNRLAIQLRSGHGAGGVLAALDLGAGHAPIVSDSAWRIVRRHHPGLLPGWQPLVDADDDRAGGLVGEAPYSWGRPPVGRWGRPETVEERPLAAAVVAPCAPLPSATLAAGSRRQVFDWGREVYGYVTFHFAPAEADGAVIGLLATGDEPRRPLEDPGAAVTVVRVPGLPVWTDAVPRRFRYASVAGLPPLLGAELLPVVDSALAAGLPTAQRSDPVTLLGLEAPLHITPAERAVRRQLDGIDGP